MKIGLLGGSFNPVHKGHLAIAETAKKNLYLDQIWFIPTACHPLKHKKDLLDYEKRLKLLTKVIANYPFYKVSLLDSNQASKNFTYDLVKKLQKTNPSDELYFIAGSDIVNELHLWYKYKWLLENLNFVIIIRPDYKINSGLNPAQFNKLIFLEMEPVSISASEIRKRIKKNQSIKGLVPENIISDTVKYYQNLDTVI